MRCPPTLWMSTSIRQKTEVRFARENDIFDLVYHAVKLALSQPGTGERQFVFDSEKEDDASNEHKNSGNKEKCCKE